MWFLRIIHKHIWYVSFLDPSPCQCHILRALCQPLQGEMWNQMHDLVFIYQVPFASWPYAFHWVASSEATVGLSNFWIYVPLCGSGVNSSGFPSFSMFLSSSSPSYFTSNLDITSCKIWSCIALINTSGASCTPRDEVQSFCMVYQTLCGFSDLLLFCRPFFSSPASTLAIFPPTSTHPNSDLQFLECALFYLSALHLLFFYTRMFSSPTSLLPLPPFSYCFSMASWLS